MNKNYYKILGISNNATQSEIKKSYFAKAKMYHPDVCKDKDAEEKFKEVSIAYETLNDVNLRQKYDDHIKNPTNSNNYNDAHSYKKDFSILNRMFSSNSNDDSFFFSVLKNNFKTETEIASAYAYFWLSFWSGGKGTIEMLKHKNASRIFKAFCSNDLIKQMKISLTKEIHTNSKKREYVSHIKTSLKKIYDNIPETSRNSQATFNWMFKVINQNNIFDDESSMYYFLLVSNDVFRVLKKFEQIFDANSSIRPKSHYSNNTKVVRGGGLTSVIIVIVILIIIFSSIN